jgi:hypothetical protein
MYNINAPRGELIEKMYNYIFSINSPIEEARVAD